MNSTTAKTSSLGLDQFDVFGSDTFQQSDEKMNLATAKTSNTEFDQFDAFGSDTFKQSGEKLDSTTAKTSNAEFDQFDAFGSDAIKQSDEKMEHKAKSSGNSTQMEQSDSMFDDPFKDFGQTKSETDNKLNTAVSNDPLGNDPFGNSSTNDFAQFELGSLDNNTSLTGFKQESSNQSKSDDPFSSSDQSASLSSGPVQSSEGDPFGNDDPFADSLSSTKTDTVSDDPFASFTESSSGLPESKDANASESKQADDPFASDDPFADDDPFASPKSNDKSDQSSDKTFSEDPFASFSDSTSQGGPDPFGAETKQSDDPFQNDDPFKESSNTDNLASDDPFASFTSTANSSSSTATQDDPFASFSSSYSTAPSKRNDSNSQDPFASFGNFDSPTSDRPDSGANWVDSLEQDAYTSLPSDIDPLTKVSGIQSQGLATSSQTGDSILDLASLDFNSNTSTPSKSDPFSASDAPTPVDITINASPQLPDKSSDNDKGKKPPPRPPALPEKTLRKNSLNKSGLESKGNLDAVRFLLSTHCYALTLSHRHYTLALYLHRSQV